MALTSLIFAGLLAGKAHAAFNGLALTPQMGWNTWNAFSCNIDEELILSTAQQIIDLGFRDLGYKYVVVDDCWSAGRNSTGHLQPNPTKFPNGITPVAEKLHSLGLGMGIYSDAGSLTCGRFEGSLGHEDIDAQIWASWGIDYLKYDNCFNEGQSGTPEITFTRYKKMADALNATGRPILYSMCNWGEDYPWKWAQTVGNSWRMSGDIFDTYNRDDARCPCSGDESSECSLAGWHCPMMNILNKVANFPDKGIPGAWNDMDMLEVGNGGMSDDEYITHFSMWAALRSPLIMGNDMRKMTPSTLSILSNPAVLAVSQDPATSPAFRRWRYLVGDKDENGKGEIQMWSGDLSGGDMLVVLLNAGNNDREMNATLADIFWDHGPGGSATQVQQAWDVYDLWGNRMDNATANAIISAANENSNSTTADGSPVTLVSAASDASSVFRYNATAMGGYAPGLAQNNPALLGKKIGSVAARGKLTARVRRHGVGMFRLRAQATTGSTKDEL